MQSEKLFFHGAAMNEIILNIDERHGTGHGSHFYAVHINSQETEFCNYCLTRRCSGGAYRLRSDGETIELLTFEDGPNLYALCAFESCPYELYTCDKSLIESKGEKITVRVLRELGKA